MCESDIMKHMKKIILIIITVLVLFVAVVLGVVVHGVSKSTGTNIKNLGALSPKDATYKIEGQAVTLKNGVSEIAVSRGPIIHTQYFGNEVKHDFDGDGREDVAFILTQQSGGTGTFYYVVAALNTANGYVGSDAVLLGDRIAPQTTEMGKGNTIVVNYADRAQSEPMTTPPSIGKSKWLLLDTKTMQFGEVAQNFEGEADPARMTLGMHTWTWVSAAYSNGKQVIPRDPKRFTITFKNNGTFAATTDCNGASGNYAVNGSKISFGQMVSTMMYCEGSQEGDFTKMLGEVDSYLFTSKGELILNFAASGGSAVFR